MNQPIDYAQNHQPPRQVVTVLVSRPGVMRQSLRVRLTANPNIWLAASAGDSLTALKLVVQHQPGLLVIDSNLLDEEVDGLLAEIRAKAPATRCLVCVNTHWRMAELTAAGADAIILRHSAGEQWQETLLRLTQPAVL
jgi:DNA-binding NarL/FixJ family response regulator